MSQPDISGIKAVIFDMDGLMFNTEHVYRAAIERMGRTRGKVFTNEIHRRMMGRGVLEDVGVLKEAWDLPESREELFQERRKLFLELVDKMIKPAPGLIELLEVLRATGMRLAIVTGSSRELAERNLGKFVLKEPFEFVIDGEMVDHGKPDPEFYMTATRRLGLLPHECLAIEDSVNGIRSAKAAGCMAFAVPNEFNKEDDFSLADSTFDSLTQIAELFQSLKK
jgi:HAD superfamily hydrolase (TIGR01509 family)